MDEAKRFDRATRHIEAVATDDLTNGSASGNPVKKQEPGSCRMRGQMLLAGATVGLGIAQLVVGPTTWPGRVAPASWLIGGVGPAVWTSACYANRIVSALSFVTVCLAATSLLMAWGAVAPAAAVCGSVFIGCED